MHNQTDKKAEKKEAKKKRDRALWRLFKYLNGNYIYAFFGVIFSIINGCVFPMFAVFLADMITVLSNFTLIREGVAPEGYTQDDANSEVTDLTLNFMYAAAVSFVAASGQYILLNLVGQRVTFKLRQHLYQAILRKDVEFFGRKHNNTGELSSVLSKDCLTVRGVISSSYSAILQGIASYSFGIGIGFYSSWLLTVILLAPSLMVILSGILENKLMQGGTLRVEEDNQNDNGIFQETVNNMKTVSAIKAHQMQVNAFDKVIDDARKKDCKNSVIVGILYGIGQFSQIFLFGLGFLIGAYLVTDGDIGFKDLFRCLFGLLFAAFGAGMSQQFMPDMGLAKECAYKIFSIIDEKPKIVNSSEALKPELDGSIEFKNVSFKYPGTNAFVFKNLSFKVEPKQQAAFAGPSGTGKSTIFSLISRFYDVDEGQILLSGTDVKNIDIAYLRDQLGVVSQEPVLFNDTIEYNIRYNREDITLEDIKNAAQTANATNFIEKDNDKKNETQKDAEVDVAAGKKGAKKYEESEENGFGYQRNVGTRGSKLSGGQKQRVAIARTVARKPKIYMYDEATSALDTESEQIVQNALNKIGKGSTTLSIAHRISTIRDCDVIFVIKAGKLVEQGSYDELMKMEGEFYQINQEH